MVARAGSSTATTPMDDQIANDMRSSNGPTTTTSRTSTSKCIFLISASNIEELDGRRDHEDVEVTTINYRGAHGAAVARSGFSCYGGSSARIGGRSGGGRGGGRTGAGLAEEFWD